MTVANGVRLVFGILVALLGLLMAVGTFPVSNETVGLMFGATGIAIATTAVG